MENPFKFGTLVDNEYFTDRIMEQQHISSMLDSSNHIVLISPRRFGKSCTISSRMPLSSAATMMLSKGEKPYEHKSIPTSTTYSSIKKLMKKGFLIKEESYELKTHSSSNG